MKPDETRRNFLIGGPLAAAGLTAGGSVTSAQSDPQEDGSVAEFPRTRPGPGGPVGSPADRGKLVPGRRDPGEPPVPVEAPDLAKLPWKVVGGAKEFHLHCKHTRREFLPDMWFDVWGFNDSMPGPTIEVVQGDRVRIVVHNELPEPTTVHWHGIELPVAMDGVPGLTQDPIPPGRAFVYEFTLHQEGTFFYHSHGPMQEGMGMVGLFIIHPKAAYQPAVDKDFALLIQEFAILPQSTVPNTMSMEFNAFTVNGRSGPYGTPLVVRLGDRVRIRFANFSAIDHHPMHLHGHTFWVTEMGAGRLPESAWVPANTILVGVAEVRAVEFVANNPGDWMIHCHMFHHMMNFMSSMVGPMAGHGGMRTPGSRDMGNSLGMLNLGRGDSPLAELGPTSQGRGTGEQTTTDRAVMNGPGLPRAKAPGYRVPGFPQDMMDMKLMEMGHMAPKISKPQTRGMRNNWFTGVEALMTVLRVLPPDLYDKVVTGKGEVAPGASVPGGTPGEMPGMNMPGMKGMDMKDMKGHEMPKKKDPEPKE